MADPAWLSTCQWFCPNSASLELAKGLPVIVVAGIAAYVAWKQWKLAAEVYEVNRAKFRLDLFDKRWTLYDALWEFLSTPSEHPDANALRVAVRNLLPQFYFLFGTEIGDFAKQSLEQSTVRRQLEAELDRMDALHPDWFAKTAELVTVSQWFAANSAGLRPRFSRYMDFSTWH